MSATETKTDRQYTKEHEWTKEDGQEILIGITAFAVDQLGDITLVGLDVQVGDSIVKGKAFGTIESVKTLSDLYAPVSGTVTRINTSLEEQPELINEDPWSKGWMIAVQPSNLDAEKADLLDAAAYKDHIEHSGH